MTALHSVITTPNTFYCYSVKGIILLTDLLNNSKIVNNCIACSLTVVLYGSVMLCRFDSREYGKALNCSLKRVNQPDGKRHKPMSTDVYKLKCTNCPKFDIGETWRAFKIRIKEGLYLTLP